MKASRLSGTVVSGAAGAGGGVSRSGSSPGARWAKRSTTSSWPSRLTRAGTSAAGMKQLSIRAIGIGPIIIIVLAIPGVKLVMPVLFSRRVRWKASALSASIAIRQNTSRAANGRAFAP